MNLWNIKNLPLPPIDTYKAIDTHIDIKHLKRVFEDGKNLFENEQHMSAEYAVLSRIVYRTKQKFRSAKDFKALVKIHRALDNYFKTNLSSDLQNFIDLIPSSCKNETYFPNKNILDYILVRLQGLVKLLERIVETCKISAYLFERRLHTGHFWKIGLIIFSIVSRIYVLAKHNAKFICEFYGKAFPFSQQLKNSGRNWLPKNYVLPTDLKKWMNVDWLDIDDELQIIEPSDLSRITQYFDLIDEDDIEISDEYVMVEDDEELDFTDSLGKGNNINKQNMNFLRGFYTDEDVGEVIEINDESLMLNQNEGVQKYIGEVIEVDDSLLLNENITLNKNISDNSKVEDYGEVIETNDSEQSSLGIPLPDFKENENNGLTLNTSKNFGFQNGRDECETTQIISLLDETARSDIQNTRNSSPIMIPIKDDVKILDVSSKCKMQKKKKAIKKKKILENTNGKKKNVIMSTNSRISQTLTESDSENVIILSDSSLTHDDVPNTNTKKKKAAKNKSPKKIESSLHTTGVIDLCSNETIKEKEENKKFRTDQRNLISLTPIHSEFQCSSVVKRKGDVLSKTPSKKIKNTHINAHQSTRIHIKKEKKIKMNQLTSKTQHISDAKEVPQNNNQINGVHKRRKDKFKKKTHLQHIAKKVHYNTQELKTPQRPRRRKYRYFL